MTTIHQEISIPLSTNKLLDNLTNSTLETPRSNSFAYEMGKTVIKTFSLVSLDLFFTPKIVKVATDKFGICLGNFLSERSISYLNSVVVPLGKFNSQLGELFGKSLPTDLLKALLEEVEFRWFLQEVLLRKLPKKTLEQVSPDLAKIVDTLPFRITRVAAASLIFAICHTYALDCSAGGGLYQLIGGLLYGSIYEFSAGSVVDSANMHGLYNFLRFYF